MSVFEFVFEGGWRERVAASGDHETPDELGGSSKIPTFDHSSARRFRGRQALQQGSRRLPRGYAALSDQLRRALLFLGIAEA